MRLIDADALREQLCIQCANGTINDDCKDSGCGYSKIVDSMPTIEPEVRQGRWIIDKGDMWCSECGYEDVTENGEPEDYHYCPHCGTKMDGGDSDA